MKIVSFIGGLLLLLAAFGSVEAKKTPSSVISRPTATKTISINNNKLNNVPPADSTDIYSIRAGADNNDAATAVMSAINLALIEKLAKFMLKKAEIDFPSALGGCLLLFSTLIMFDVAIPRVAERIYQHLLPGANLLAKWLPVFFVPGLAMLPLSPKIGNGTEIAKAIAVILLGFLYTILTTTYSVVLAKKLTNKPSPPGFSALTGLNINTAFKTTPTPVKPYSEQTLQTLLNGAIVSGILAVVALKNNWEYADPVRTLFLGLTTVTAYVWGARLPTDFCKIVHPLVTSSAILLAVIQGLAKVTGSTFYNTLRSYRTNSLSWPDAGAGDILLYMLGPAVVSFAISMYSRRGLLFNNLFVVMTAVIVSAAGGLFGTAAFVNLIQLGGRSGRVVRLSVLSRNVTTALSMALAQMIGGDMAIAASAVVLSGIIGATYGKMLLTRLEITDPVTRGLAIGASAQGLGVASISDEPDAFPFAAISMVMTAIMATMIVTVPAAKQQLISMATSNTLSPANVM